MEQLAEVSAPRRLTVQEACESVTRFDRFEPRRWYPQHNWRHGCNVGIQNRYSFRLARDTLDHPSVNLSRVDEDRAEPLGKVHDVKEAASVFGTLPFKDYQAVHKRYFRKYFPARMAQIEQEEVDATPWVAANVEETFDGFPTLELLEETDAKQTFLGQLYKYNDVVDCFCYAFHEILAGNLRFAQRQRWIYEGRTFYLPNPSLDCEEYCFPRIRGLLPLIAPLIERPISPLFVLPRRLSSRDYVALARAGKPHTPASIRRMILSQEFPMYSAWLKVLVDNDPTAMDWLTTINSR